MSETTPYSLPHGVAWYCLQTLPKKERIAATLARREAGVEALAPQLSYIKKTRRGKVRFTEALFPGYIFVHCDLVVSLRHLLSLQGIRTLVRYGERVPSIEADWIEELRAGLIEDTVHVAEPDLQDGDSVTVMEGPFRSLQAIVSGQIGPDQRVQLLLEFLGRQIEVSVSRKDVMRDEAEPVPFLKKRSDA